MKNDINLLTKRKSVAEHSKKSTYILFMLLFAVILLAGIVLPSRTRTAAEQQLAALEFKLQASTVSQSSIDEALALAAHIGSQLSDLEALYSSRSDILSYLSSIEESLPNTAELAQLKFSGNMLTITGTAPDDTAVATFCLKLRESGLFSSVFLKNSTAPSEKTTQTMFTAAVMLPSALSGAALETEGDAGAPAVQALEPAATEAQP